MKKYFTSFNKLLLSHVVIIIIPIIVVILFYYPRLNRAIKGQILESNYHSLSNVQQSIDTNLEDLFHTYVSMSSNTELSTYFLEASPINRIKGKDALQRYLESNKFIDNALIYLKNLDTLMEKRGLSEFVENYFYFENWKYEDIKHDMSTTDSITFLPEDKYYFANAQADHVIPVILPLNYLSNTSIVFLINRNTFINIFENSSSNEYCKYYLLNEDNGLIISNDDGNTLIKEIQYLLNGDQLQHSQLMTLKDEEYVVSIKASTASSIKYVSILPYNNVIGEISKTQKESIYMVILLVLAGSLISYWLSRINYRPVKTLTALFNDTAQSELEDYQLIQYNIKKLIQQNTQMSEQVTRSIPANQEFLLKQVINNQIQSKKEFNLLGAHYGISLKQNVFAVIIIKTKNHRFNEEQVNNISTISYDGVTGYFNWGLQKDSLILIAGYSKTSSLEKYLKRIEQYLIEHVTNETYIGVSDQLYSFAEMNQGYNQGLKVIEYVVLKSKNGIYQYKDLPQLSNQHIMYPSNLIVDFKNTLLTKDTKQIKKTYEKLTLILNDDLTTPSIIKQLAFDLYSIMYNQISEKQKPYLNGDNFLIDVLYKNYSLKQISDKLSILFDLVTVTSPSDKEEALITSILIYINNNYNDYNISLSEVAEIFNMTPSNLSHYFKKQTKVNFLSYIKYLRIDEAKKLLMTTELTVNEISRQVGFYATTSFNRTFKKEIGMTPLQYKTSEKEANK